MTVFLGSFHVVVEAYRMTITASEVSTHVEIFLFTQCNVRTQSCIRIPVTIDIHWSSGLHTCILIVSGFAAHVVSHNTTIRPCPQTALLFTIVGIEITIEIMGERRFQLCITLADIERIRVVGNIKQVCHTWLLGASIIAKTNIGVLTEIPAKIRTWSPIEHRTFHLGIVLSHVLIVELCALRQEVDTDTGIVALTHTTQLHTDILIIVSIFRELAETHRIAHLIAHLFHEAKHGIHVVAVSKKCIVQRTVSL